ncbi:MAG TPA: carbohydrate ABC transporter permease, partial [Victivallales bacterium]|nr:carbohydrate ABC transporter permease [Victivallales bacterium]
MPIISTIERKTLKGKLGLLLIYTILILGAVSTVYPFLLMLRRTTTDDIDKDSLMPIPEFWWNRDHMARKYLLYQYHIALKTLPWIYNAFSEKNNDGTQFFKWEYLGQANANSVDKKFHTYFWEENYSRFEKIPKTNLLNRIKDYEEFVQTANLWFIQPLFTYSPGRNFNNQWIQFYLAKKENVNPKKYQYFEPLRPQWTRRDWFPEFNENLDKWNDWIKNGLLPQEKLLYSSNFLWGHFLMKKYKNNIDALSKAHKKNYQSFANGPLFTVKEPASEDPIKNDWNDFIVNYYPLLWQKIKPEAIPKYQEKWRKWLSEKKKVNSITEWNLRTQQKIISEKEMEYSAQMPYNDAAARWWCEFTTSYVPPADRIINSPENDFSEFLSKKYGSIEKLNNEWAANFADFTSVIIPRAECDYYVISNYSSGIRQELTFGNYKRVLKILALEGQAAQNTLIIVILALLTGLTVNPLAAYALSRFRLKSTHKILIFLLATMALPAEIAMVPSFLLVKNLGLINSYFALVLPHAANAFSIFLLKGFFDSLPAELYEAAMLDGANEAQIFLNITIPLSMPIISVMILNITMGAYN